MSTNTTPTSRRVVVPLEDESPVFETKRPSRKRSRASFKVGKLKVEETPVKSEVKSKFDIKLGKKRKLDISSTSSSNKLSRQSKKSDLKISRESPSSSSEDIESMRSPFARKKRRLKAKPEPLRDCIGDQEKSVVSSTSTSRPRPSSSKNPSFDGVLASETTSPFHVKRSSDKKGKRRKKKKSSSKYGSVLTQARAKVVTPKTEAAFSKAKTLSASSSSTSSSIRPKTESASSKTKTESVSSKSTMLPASSSSTSSSVSQNTESVSSNAKTESVSSKTKTESTSSKTKTAPESSGSASSSVSPKTESVSSKVKTSPTSSHRTVSRASSRSASSAVPRTADSPKFSSQSQVSCLDEKLPKSSPKPEPRSSKSAFSPKKLSSNLETSPACLKGADNSLRSPPNCTSKPSGHRSPKPEQPFSKSSQNECPLVFRKQKSLRTLPKLNPVFPSSDVHAVTSPKSAKRDASPTMVHERLQSVRTKPQKTLVKQKFDAVSVAPGGETLFGSSPTALLISMLKEDGVVVSPDAKLHLHSKAKSLFYSPKSDKVHTNLKNDRSPSPLFLKKGASLESSSSPSPPRRPREHAAAEHATECVVAPKKESSSNEAIASPSPPRRPSEHAVADALATRASSQRRAPLAPSLEERDGVDKGASCLPRAESPNFSFPDISDDSGAYRVEKDLVCVFVCMCLVRAR